MSNLVDAVRERAAELSRRADSLRRAEARTRAIIDTANDAFVAMDEQGRIIAFNPRAEKMSGYRAEEVLGRPLTQTLVPARLHQAFDHEFRRFVETGESSLVNRPIEFVGRHSDGREFPVELTIAPLRERAGGCSTRSCATSPSASGPNSRSATTPRTWRAWPRWRATSRA